METKLDDSLLKPVEDAMKILEVEKPPVYMETGETIEEINRKNAGGREADIIEAAVEVVSQWSSSYDTVVKTDEQFRLITAVDEFHKALREERRNRRYEGVIYAKKGRSTQASD